MKQERENERRQRTALKDAETAALQEKHACLAAIRRDLFALFGEPNAQKRGKALEGVLNRLFAAFSVLVRESFTLRGTSGEGIVEQIDGVVEVDGHLYLVEMKWYKDPLGKAEVSQHLVTVYHRSQSRGILISASGFTEPSITICKEGLQKSVFVLCKLEEIVLLLERGLDLREFLKSKIYAAMTHKNPLHDPIAAGEIR
jgi:restriction system protein